MEAPRIHSANTHGTGCTLSSAIAAHLALGKPLPEAVRCARDYVWRALRAGAPVRTGAGGGSLDHGYSPQSTRLLPLPAQP
jgi:hydroxymethylpyrimidine/phosphomethylpyrimidine kinase